MRATALQSTLLVLLASPALAGHCPIPGDIAPSPGGDAAVTVSDAVVALRWAVGLEEPLDQHEARAADVAPTAERSFAFCELEPGGACATEAVGDGVIDVADVIVILRTAVGHPLGWRYWSSGSVVTGLPEHLAIRWRVPDVPGECDGPIVATHAERRILSESVPCASTEVAHWERLGELRGVFVTCEHGEARSGNGAFSAFWRSPTRPPWAGPYEHQPSRIEIRLPSGAWQSVSLR